MIEIGGLQKSTLIDYSGKIACTVFLVGCNLRCPWCHSPEIVLPDLITKQPIMEKQDFFSFLDSRKGLLDGVVVCGGEPTINKDLPEFIGEIKERGFSVKLDTNGTNPSMIRSLLDKKLIDYIAMDLKAPIDKESYSLAVGVDLDTLAISESVKLIKESGIDYEFRTTVVPGIHGIDEIKKIAEAIAPAKKYFIQVFQSVKNVDRSFVGKDGYSDNYMKEIKRNVEKMFDLCEIR